MRLTGVGWTSTSSTITTFFTTYSYFDFLLSLFPSRLVFLGGSGIYYCSYASFYCWQTVFQYWTISFRKLVYSYESIGLVMWLIVWRYHPFSFLLLTNTKGIMKQFLIVAGASSAFYSSGLYASKKLKSLICLWIIGIAWILDSNPNAAYSYNSLDSGFDSV
jgi:hypothetical protein